MKVAWLLLTRSGRNNWNRLGLITTAIALGMLMVLIFMAGINALEARAQHRGWAQFDSRGGGNATKPIEGVSPLKTKIDVEGDLDKWQNEDIMVTSLRATGSTSPQLAGLPTPKEGEYYVSRGLDQAMRASLNAHIGERFGSKQIGIIPNTLSASPDALEVIRGMSQVEASGAHVADIYRFPNEAEVASWYSGQFGVMLLFGATILLFPIVMFISIATQLGSVQREKRYAALRLIGATRRQVTQIMAVESLSAALVGVMLGSLAYLVVLPLMAGYQFESMRFWQSDLTVPIGQYLLAVSLTLIFCLLTNWWGLRRVQVSPLGVARTQTSGKRPRIWQLLLLIPGIATFIWMALPTGKTWVGENVASDGLVLLVLIVGITCVMFGLILAGPWLTTTISSLIAGRTQNVTILLATKRIAVRSRQVFRSVGGVVLALFAGSFYLTAVGSVGSIVTATDNGYSQLKEDTAIVVSDAALTDFDVQLRTQSYVQSVATVGVAEDRTSLIDCKVLATYTKHTCPSGSDANDKILLNFGAATVKEVAIIKDVPPVIGKSYLVQLDSNSNLDQLRTFVTKTTGLDSPTQVVSGTYSQLPMPDPIMRELSGLAYAGMAVTLFVAIASLAISTIGGLLERQRSFVTLRLGGMTVGQMKRTVMIESLIPLISVSLLAASLGVWVGVVFTSAMSARAEPALTPLYFAIVGGSMAMAIVAIRLVLPMLDRITRPEANQTE
jgi:hypothetical protein